VPDNIHIEASIHGGHRLQLLLSCVFNLLLLYGYVPGAFHRATVIHLVKCTRRPASADRTARRQFQAVFPVITGSFPTNVIADLHRLNMDLTVERTGGPIATVG